jgi:hypothetical protein
MITLAHGPNEVSYDLSGGTVAYAREALRDVLNLREDMAAWVDGRPVSDGYVLRQGDAVAFLDGPGEKGLGRLLAPEELMEQWSLTRPHYEELLGRGLPSVRFQDGTVRHPEVPVDDWFRMGGYEKVILNDLEEEILDALGSDHLRGEKIAARADRNYDSRFKDALAALVRRGLLGNTRQSGYCRTHSGAGRG